jgi:short-subunit dehydrogenase
MSPSVVRPFALLTAEDAEIERVPDLLGPSGGTVEAVKVDLTSEDSGVTVTSLMPGPTDTEFFARADMLDTKVGAGDKDDSADVARDGFEALMRGDERVVSHSLSTKLQGRGSRLMPDRVKAMMHRRMAESGSARR